MTREIFIDGQRILLDPAQLIQSGGEGMVFGLGRNNSATAVTQATAVKLYHQPTPQHAAKLHHFVTSGLAAHLPQEILGPCALATDSDGHVIGFQMPRLPTGSRPIKKLSNPYFWQKNKPPLDDILALFQQIHAVLTRLHQLGLVIGDLNDHNLFFTWRDARFIPSFIDVDSYQFGGFPCPVALQAFLDPALYSVTDFGKRPYFTPETDWYAYAVLLVKSLLHVHPYGGTHKQHKSLPSRAQAGVSLLDTAVTYPKTARPLNTLSDDLKHQIHLIFERGQRAPFPIHLLASQHFSAAAGQPVSQPTLHHSAPSIQHSKLLLAVDGVIEHVAVGANGRIQAIVRENEAYKLVRLGIGGVLDEMTLFTGNPGYRFAIFGRYLAVNPPERPHLLILDIGGRQPSQITMMETAFFRETAVFAATSRHLYRIAGTWIMRGSVRDGLYVEDAIATAHRHQTRFWASPVTETLLGSHRIFAENRFFLLHNGANYDLPIPQLALGESLVGIETLFSQKAAAIQLTIRHTGQLRTDSHVFDFQGQRVPVLPPSLPPANTLPHPNGRLLHEPTRLTFLPK